MTPMRTRPVTAFRFAFIGCATMVMTVVGHAQSFTQTFGGPGAQDGIGAWPAPEGYRVAIRTHDSMLEGFNAVLQTTNATGGTLGAITWPITGNAFIQATVPAVDGSAFIIGSVLTGGVEKHDILFSKVIPDGTIQWTRTVALSGSQQLFGGHALPDGGAVFCGLTEVAGLHQPFAVRCDAAGDTIWSHVEPMATDAELYAVATDGDHLLFTGRTMTFGGHDDVLLFKADMAGAPIWSTSIGGTATDKGRSIAYAGNNEWVVAGWTDSVGPLDQSSQRRSLRAYLIGLNDDGDTTWTRTFGDTLYDQRLFAMERVSPADIYLAGDRSTPYGSDAVLMKVSASGELLWERVLDLGREDRLSGIMALPDGVIGTGWSFGDYGRQVLFVRRGPDGN